MCIISSREIGLGQKNPAMIEPHALACSGLGFSQLSCTVSVFATFPPMSENTLYKRGISNNLITNF